MSQMTQLADFPHGLCWECGYSLRGLETPRCPECGRPFDPANPATMNMDTHVGPFVQRLMDPPGWPLFTLVGVATLLSLWAAATPMPGGYIGSILIQLHDWLTFAGWYTVISSIDSPHVRYLWAMLAWTVVFLVWLPRRVLRGITVVKVSRQRAATFAYWRRWLIPHFVLGATVLFCMTPAPVYIGFWLSKPGLDRLVEQRRKGAPAPAGVSHVGIYPYRERFAGRNVRPPARVVHISPYGGFIYSPGRPPQRGAIGGMEYRFRYAGGGWYIFDPELP